MQYPFQFLESREFKVSYYLGLLRLSLGSHGLAAAPENKMYDPTFCATHVPVTAFQEHKNKLAAVT